MGRVHQAQDHRIMGIAHVDHDEPAEGIGYIRHARSNFHVCCLHGCVDDGCLEWRSRIRHVDQPQAGAAVGDVRDPVLHREAHCVGRGERTEHGGGRRGRDVDDPDSLGLREVCGRCDDLYVVDLVDGGKHTQFSRQRGRARVDDSKAVVLAHDREFPAPRHRGQTLGDLQPGVASSGRRHPRFEVRRRPLG
jgi:hypothetical protein